MAAHDVDGQRGPLGGGGIPGAIVAWVLWWFVSAALWLALVDNVHLHELYAGAVVAVIGASAALVVRSQRKLVLRPRLRWLLPLWRPLLAYPRDMVLVTAELVRALRHGRRTRSRLIAISFRTEDEDSREAARRVLMKTAGSFAPNTYVVGADDDNGVLLLHQLAPRPDPAADADPLGLC